MEENVMSPWQIKDMIESLPKGTYLVSADEVEGTVATRDGQNVIRYQPGCFFSVQSAAYGLSVYDSALRYVSFKTTEYLKFKVVEPDEVGPDTGGFEVVGFIEKEKPYRSLWGSYL